MGLLGGADTLGSQAFGARNVRRVGFIYQRGAAVSLFFAVPIAVLWWFSGDVLALMGQQPETVSLTQRCVVARRDASATSTR